MKKGENAGLYILEVEAVFSNMNLYVQVYQKYYNFYKPILSMNNSGYFVSILLYARLLQIKRSFNEFTAKCNTSIKIYYYTIFMRIMFPFSPKIT